MIKVIWTKAAYGELRKVDRRYQDKIYDAGNALADFPNVAMDIMKLEDSGNHYRLRKGDYRVFFEWIKDDPAVINIFSVRRRTSKTY